MDFILIQFLFKKNFEREINESRRGHYCAQILSMIYFNLRKTKFIFISTYSFFHNFLIFSRFIGGNVFVRLFDVNCFFLITIHAKFQMAIRQGTFV